MDICRAMIIRSRELRGIINEPSASDLTRSAEAWADELASFPIAEIKQMFDRAIRDYRDTTIPFGVPQLKAARFAMAAESRPQIKTEIPARCENHELVEVNRGDDDPPLIQSWRICPNCHAAFPKLSKSIFPRLAPAAAPAAVEVVTI